jgi:ATP-dependent RNA helicase DeaD
MNPSFQELGISEDRVQHLEQLGFTEPTNIQA